MYFSLLNSFEYLGRPKNCFENFVPVFRGVEQVTLLRITEGHVKNDVRELRHR